MVYVYILCLRIVLDYDQRSMWKEMQDKSAQFHKRGSDCLRREICLDQRAAFKACSTVRSSHFLPAGAGPSTDHALF